MGGNYLCCSQLMHRVPYEILTHTKSPQTSPEFYFMCSITPIPILSRYVTWRPAIAALQFGYQDLGTRYSSSLCDLQATWPILHAPARFRRPPSLHYSAMPLRATVPYIGPILPYDYSLLLVVRSLPNILSAVVIIISPTNTIHMVVIVMHDYIPHQ
jgi:hypothetical protein